jgi:transposase
MRQRSLKCRHSFSACLCSAAPLIGSDVSLDIGAIRSGEQSRLKLLRWDGDGLCLFAKRLERGRFIWPMAERGTVRLSRAQFSMLLEGIDWRRVERTRTPEAAL